MTERRETPLDAVRILTTLAERGVDYVMIGGLAVQAHGHTRTTQHADILPAPHPDNLQRLAAALHELHARTLSPGGPGNEIEARDLEAVDTLALDTDAGGIDVHRAPPGAPPYDKLRARALVVEVAGVAVAFADRDDLIAMKRASRRPIDLGDIAALTAGL